MGTGLKRILVHIIRIVYIAPIHLLPPLHHLQTPGISPWQRALLTARHK